MVNDYSSICLKVPRGMQAFRSWNASNPAVECKHFIREKQVFHNPIPKVPLSELKSISKASLILKNI